MSDEEVESKKKQRGLIPRLFAFVFASITWSLVLIGGLWAFGALWFDFPDEAMKPWVASGFALFALLVLFSMRPVWRAKLVVVVSIVLVMVWWFTIPPRQYRDWKTEVALLPYAQIENEIVTIHNVRNFDYRTDKEFTPVYETRRYDLRNLRGVDMFINYWGSPYMAHPIVSFDFGRDGHVCFSIETRPEKGEAYSAIGGLYRQFELIYIVADERDVIRLRTNYRKGEDSYVYRLNAPKARESFMEYVRTVNELKETPRWYNAITNNCTTAIRHQRAADERAPFDWRMIVNGFGDQLLYDRKVVNTALPFNDLKRAAHINERAKAADSDPAFSARIRQGVPGMPTTAP